MSEHVLSNNPTDFWTGVQLLIPDPRSMDFVGKQTFGFRRVCEPTCPSACWLAPHHATAGTWHIPCCPGVKQHLWGSSVDPCWSSLQDSAAPGHPAVSATCFTSELNFLLNNTWWLEKCSRNHCISEKYKSIQLFKLHFFHKNPLELVYTSNSYYKGFGNFPGIHFVQNFSVLPSHS